MTLTKVRDRGTTGISTDLSGVNNSISRLGLRVIANQNLAGINGNDISYDTFEDSTKITSLTNVARDSSEFISSVASSEVYETGDRESSYTITLGGLSAQNDFGNNTDVGNWLNGSNASGTSNGWYWAHNGSNFDGATITFDLGSGNSKIYTGAKFYQDANFSSGNWLFQGSNNGSSWTNLSSTFVWQPDSGSGSNWINEELWSNNTAYRYIRLEGQSGAVSEGNSWQKELEFKVKTITASATGSFESTSITAPASTNKMGAVLTYTNTSGTASLNTDLILDLSADNGSNYNRATLTALPDFASGVKCCKVNDLDITNAGTQLKYKISFANQSLGSKETRVTGVSLQY